ncbi:hypothetical protein U0C82_01170 [Fulvimarina sp. 2208YS6-2-32]|uniref:Uncharacterized protein n=1 Tax=Fulvimarina uroteuthidis TaxID=3098149 RepID=A0ABU5HXR2_9HYPH|nr:hypothetical protein [Fulvimarina sp. 2208YS6-2-32]MDY8107756.1 hypothetical protein [Fulvimarina sp. 2208YS6-2-32]
MADAPTPKAPAFALTSLLTDPITKAVHARFLVEGRDGMSVIVEADGSDDPRGAIRSALQSALKAMPA